MTRYSPTIAFVLAWQLLMPILCYFSGFSCLAALATAALFVILLASKRWERNSYSAWSAAAVVILSLSLAASSIGLFTRMGGIIQVLWIYALIAYTATSPYPLAIRMPVIIYTLACIFMLPPSLPPLCIIPAAMIFAAAMCGIAIRWRRKASDLAIAQGPPEPPFSLSLATAIVLAVVINLCADVADYHGATFIARIISMALLSAICIWLLLANDWQKNTLALTALVLMITGHGLTIAEHIAPNHLLRAVAYALSVAPVMFHTTAPVFRGMRIVITLFAVYTALNRQHLISALANTPLPLWQQQAAIIALDAILAATLLIMALHWRRTTSQ